MPDIKVFQPIRILSSTTTGELLQGISQSLAAGKIYILVDLQNVLFIDSTGLSALVVALKRVRDVNGRFALCGLNSQAKILLEQTSMTKIFETYTNREEFNHALSE
jgi:anti-anti-sigma factor